MVSLLAPDGERVDQQDDELPVLHANGNHFSVGTVGRALGRMAQTHLVQEFLRQKAGLKEYTVPGEVSSTPQFNPVPYQPGPIFGWSRHRWRR